MGGDSFLQLVNQTLEETMMAEGFSQVFLNDIVAPITRVNYGQSVRINGFVGTFTARTRPAVESVSEWCRSTELLLWSQGPCRWRGPIQACGPWMEATGECAQDCCTTAKVSSSRPE